YCALFSIHVSIADPAFYLVIIYTDLIQGSKYPRGVYSAVVNSFIKLAHDNGVEFQLGTEATEIVTFGKQRRHALAGTSKPRVRGVRVRDDRGSRQRDPQTLTRYI